MKFSIQVNVEIEVDDVPTANRIGEDIKDTIEDVFDAIVYAVDVQQFKFDA